MSDSPPIRQRRQELPDAEQALAPQIGSDPNRISKGEFDVRRIANVNPIEIVWLSYFLEIPDEEGGEFAKNFVDNYLNLGMSKDGKRVNQMINMVGSSKGGQMRKVDTRSWTERHLTLRDETKAREKGKIENV